MSKSEPHAPYAASRECESRSQVPGLRAMIPSPLMATGKD